MNHFVRLYGDACAAEGLSMNPAVIERLARAVAEVDAQAPGAPLLTLRFDGLVCGEGDWAAVSAALPGLALGALSLEESYVGDLGLRAVCRGLASGPALGALGVGRQPSPCGLRSLVLKHAALRDASPLAEALAACPRLSFLDLSRNRLGVCAEGVVGLCRALGVHPGLAAVDLADNLLQGRRGGDVVQALSELLVRSGRPESALRALHLQDNQLGDYFLIPSTLPGSHPTRWGGLVDREGGAGLGVLCEGPNGAKLEAAGAVQDAMLPFVPPSALLGAHPFMEALFLNNTLEEFRLEGNGFPDGLLEWIEAKMRVNRRTRQRYMKEFSAQNRDELPIVMDT
ncbi:unnamed protein product [Phytomonas sp. Hart1]|nr:unnamed protein product [Phytomonas sp. Hart1]|eukprot:CCW71689.1 unnamed protein product [Phytomonas sp. isolate Hart1]